MRVHVLDSGGASGGDSGGDSGGSRLSGGVVGGGYVGEPFPQGAPFLLFRPLGEEINPHDFNFHATFPWSAWRPDLFGVMALAEFGRTDWRCIDPEPPPSDPRVIFHEIEELVAMARDVRPGRVDEILDQNARVKGYFAQVLMLSAWSHPNTLKLIEMALRVGQMVAVHFKLKYNRARPQQVFPPLVPLLNSPWHASFPSGHSLESHMIALALAEVAPNTRKALIALADRIGHNREIAGVHYPSDTRAGKKIACAAFPLLHKCPIFQTILKAARKEPGLPGHLHPPEECDEPVRKGSTRHSATGTPRRAASSRSRS